MLLIGGRCCHGPLTGSGRICRNSLPGIFHGKIHGVFPIIEIDHIDGHILDRGGILIVGKDLKCGGASRGGRTGNFTSRSIQTHPTG